MKIKEENKAESAFDFTKLPQKIIFDHSNEINIDASQIFGDRNHVYLNELNLYLTCFKYIPNLINESNINCRKANIWFATKYKSQIIDWYYNKRYFRKNKKVEFDDIFYILYDDLIVNFDTNDDTVRFLFRKTDIVKVEEIINSISKFRIKKNNDKPELLLLVQTQFGMDTKSLEINKPKLNIEDNYNDDFKEIHAIIHKRLAKKKDKGLVLLHGKPGTGKTSYIRYLIASLKKNVIFLPPDMAGNITNPGLISILIDNPESIFVIEDAENIIVDREIEGISPVSALLNISDGLLSDCLNIQIICSFNTDISKVDSALMRKGRLIAKYEFKELTIQKSQQLSDKLGFQTIIDVPMTVSEIYNQEDKSFEVASKNFMGFKSKNS